MLRSDGIFDVIYFGDNGLYEKTVMSDTDIGFSGGDRIFELNGNLYKITVVFNGGENSTLIRKG